jgi:hypothetical protein
LAAKKRRKHKNDPQEELGSLLCFLRLLAANSGSDFLVFGGRTVIRI